MPWDHGTREPEHDRLAEPRRSWWRRSAPTASTAIPYTACRARSREASDALGPSAGAASPKSTISAEEQLSWNKHELGLLEVPTRSSRRSAKFKWLEPRHMVNFCEPLGAATATDDLQYAFFNGIGYESWENIWGIWNQFTPRDAEALRRIVDDRTPVRRRCWSARTGSRTRRTLQTRRLSPAASPPATCTLWTLVNRNEYAVDGEQIAVAASQTGTRYYDAVARRGAEADVQAASAVL